MKFSLYILGTNSRRGNLTMILTSFKATNHFMKYYFPFAISTVVCLLKTVVSTPINIDHTLRRHGIIPDVIDVAPKFVINISYKRNESLRMGYKVDPADMQHVPRIEWPTKAGVFYTILMIDPDVPVRKNPSVAQRQHWIVGNIPRNDPHQGETITEYLGSISPKNSGLHRTTFLVYSQNGHINFTDEPRISLQDRSSIKYRYKFSAKKFAGRYNLTLFAVNFFRTGWPLYGLTQMIGPTRSPNNSIRGHFEPSPELLKV